MAVPSGESATEKVTITVDPGMCMGIRSCVQTAPGSFVIEDGKISRGVDEPTDELATVLDAAASCPNFAITVVVGNEVVFDPEAR
ncbi:MAG TPA: ferredoxin [Acidimicrobiales bacterium]|jgi:ferredoxin|nr:ferredoxin [Acidimicrobiales bacterium]